jgi:hypothetical protein
MRSRISAVDAVMLGLAFTLLGTLSAVRAEAQAEADRMSGLVATPSVQSVAPRTFGTDSTISHTVPAVSFTAHDMSFDTYDSTNSSRFCTVANCLLDAGVLLPAGALVTSIEVDGCDNVTDNFQVVLRRASVHGGTNPSVTLATATSSGNPGCVFVSADLATPETIDNGNNLYRLSFTSPVVGESLNFQAVRIFYTLQVSPASAVASFGDVPTSHPFFPFVEALAASGITSGCQSSPPLYCPDQALTRGQMAVFLSKALGLHFAP